MSNRFNSANPVAQIMNTIRKEVELTEQEIAEELARLGEECTNVARMNGSYTDRTGNLRSSIGYVLARDGQVVTAGQFAKIIGNENPTGQVNGDEVGKDMATQAATQLSKDGFGLVIVAGMEYASAVSGKGYDVLDSALLHAEQRIATRFAKLGFGTGETRMMDKEHNVVKIGADD